MENKENNKTITKRKREKSSKKKKYDEINSESLSDYESISEGDEDIVLEDGPSVLQPLPRLLAPTEVVNHTHEVAYKDDGAPHKQQVEHRLRHIDAQQP